MNEGIGGREKVIEPDGTMPLYTLLVVEPIGTSEPGVVDSV